jgi:aminoglycoside 3-N-acetyltransferase
MANIIKQEIKKDLTKLGLKEGSAVLTHSSLKSFGWVEGGADAVIDALIETVGASGTVLVPTLTGSVQLSAANPPVFDVLNTPCWTGTVPETFRKRKNAVRSLGATHSVAAIGKQAEFLTEGHQFCNTPCGKGSPYEKLCTIDNGYILMAGIGLSCVTAFHCAEEIAGVTYLMQPEPVNAVVIDARGNKIAVRTRIHGYGIPMDFPRAEPLLLEAGIIKIGTSGYSTLRLIKAKEMMEFILARIKENPFFLLKNGLRQQT